MYCTFEQKRIATKVTQFQIYNIYTHHLASYIYIIYMRVNNISILYIFILYIFNLLRYLLSELYAVKKDFKEFARVRNLGI